MDTGTIGLARVDRAELRRFVAEKYAEVATNPQLGFHFHTGRPLTAMLGYPNEVIDRQRVVDVGCGAGLDTLIAAQQVGPNGQVIAVDMTAEMRAKTADGARALSLTNVEVREGFAESLPVDSGWADVVISNGMVNLCPDKRAVFAEMLRLLKPGGRIQIGDILVHKMRSTCSRGASTRATRRSSTPAA